MIRKRLGLCLILLALPLLLCCGTARAAEVWDGTTAPAFAGGSGTKEDPYLIANGAQLAHVKDYEKKIVHFRLTADIALNNTERWKSWTAELGPENAWTPIQDFAGTMDGNGHTVTGMYVSGEEQLGLIGSAWEGSRIQDITIEKSRVFGTRYLGAVAGWSSGVISGCSNGGEVSGADIAGGICGLLSSGAKSGAAVTGCENHGDVSAKDGNAGGVVGYQDAVGHPVSVERCVNTGAVSSENGHAIGGVIGCGQGKDGGTLSVRDCGSGGSVSGLRNVGGVAGYLKASGSQCVVERCSGAGTVTAASDVAGGVLGCVHADKGGEIRVRDCSASGQVAGARYAGGIAGYLRTTDPGSACRVSESWFSGAVSGSKSIGGTVALAWGETAGSVITAENCFCRAPAQADVSSITGDANGTVTVTDVRALNADQSGDRECFSGFDFDRVWSMGEDGPVLRLPESGGDLGGRISYSRYSGGGLRLAAGGALAEPVTVVAASYQNGRMTSSQQVPVAPGEEQWLRLDSSGDCWKLFVLDQSFRPLCPAGTLEE